MSRRMNAEAANGRPTLVHAVDGSWEATHVLLLLLSALGVFGEQVTDRSKHVRSRQALSGSWPKSWREALSG